MFLNLNNQKYGLHLTAQKNVPNLLINIILKNVLKLILQKRSVYVCANIIHHQVQNMLIEEVETRCQLLCSHCHKLHTKNQFENGILQEKTRQTITQKSSLSGKRKKD